MFRKGIVVFRCLVFGNESLCRRESKPWIFKGWKWSDASLWNDAASGPRRPQSSFTVTLLAQNTQISNDFSAPIQRLQSPVSCRMELRNTVAYLAVETLFLPWWHLIVNKTFKHYTAARSGNHCSNERAVSLEYWELVSVALVILREKRISRIIFSVACLAIK
jgi:hypothetical protein